MLELADGLRTDGLTKERKLKMIYLMSGDQRVPYENLAHAREKAQSNLLFWRDTFKKCTHDDNYWNEVLYELSESGGRDEAERLAGEFPKGTSRHWLLVALTLTSDNPWRDFQDALKENDEPLRSLIADANFLTWLERVRPERHALMKSVFGDMDCKEWRRHLFLIWAFLMADEDSFQNGKSSVRRLACLAQKAFSDSEKKAKSLVKFIRESNESIFSDCWRDEEIELWVPKSVPVAPVPVVHVPVVRVDKPERRPGAKMTLKFPGGEKMQFRWCPATTSNAWKRISKGKDFFLMGSPQSERDHRREEQQHEVVLTKGFWMAERPVTQAQWASVMGRNPVALADEDTWEDPVESVSWNDCQRFIAKINSMLSCEVALPTEAQWEYAYRAGTTSRYPYGEVYNRHFAAEKKPNNWGIRAMCDGIEEWCADKGKDAYDDFDYEDLPRKNPVVQSAGVWVKVRGAVGITACETRSAFRGVGCAWKSTERLNFVGVRLVCLKAPKRKHWWSEG